MQFQYKKIISTIRKSKYALLVACVSFLILIGVVVCSIIQLINFEKQRGVIEWDSRLQIIADSRLNAVNSWVAEQFSTLESLASNTSLRLYASQIEQQHDEIAQEQFQVSYLRNLLNFTAQKYGFNTLGSVQINANIENMVSSGIAVLNLNKKILVSTQMPRFSEDIRKTIKELPADRSYISNLFHDKYGRAMVLFSLPITALHENTKSKKIGYVVGIRTVNNSLFQLLKQPGIPWKTFEAILVKMDNGILSYLSPVRDGSVIRNQKITAHKDLDAVFAVSNPGKFAEKRDYYFNKVLVTGRKIPKTNWVLLCKIDRNEALVASDTFIKNLIIMSIIVFLFIAAVLVAIWQYMNVVREHKFSQRYRKMMLELQSHKRILRLISDNKPEVTFIVDEHNKYCFVNREVEKRYNVSAKDIIGKNLQHVMGKDHSLAYRKHNLTALTDKKNVTETHRIKVGNDERIIQSIHIPVYNIYLGSATPRNGVIVVEQDITRPIKAEEKSAHNLNAIIDAIVSFIDKRDEHTAMHSLRVSELAVHICREMGEEKKFEKTVQIAGKLMNLGKALIPLTLLTKVGRLTVKDKRIFKESVHVSASLVEHIDFDGPVVQTIMQVQENIDGSGPMSLKGDKILITARILSVVNSYVSMRSPRAYRAQKTIDGALDAIHKEAGTKFDKKVVAALVNFIENRNGRENW